MSFETGALSDHNNKQEHQSEEVVRTYHTKFYSGFIAATVLSAMQSLSNASVFCGQLRLECIVRPKNALN